MTPLPGSPKRVEFLHVALSVQQANVSNVDPVRRKSWEQRGFQDFMTFYRGFRILAVEVLVFGVMGFGVWGDCSGDRLRPWVVHVQHV